jgi:peptidoglycan DL-endopeptidase CwlO
MPSLALRRPVLLTALLTALLVPLAGSALADDPVPAPVPAAVPAAVPAPVPAPSPAAVPTSLRITAPASVPAGSNADVWVRLVRPGDGGEDPVGGKDVLVQRSSSSGWVQVASLTTRDDGLAHAPVAIGSTGRFRAFFRGDDTAASSTSREVVISATSTLADRALAEAKRHKGQPYAYGAAGPSRFDCSGFTMYVFKQLGRSLPHSSAQQARVVTRVADSAKKPGDLIFTYHGGTIGHVGIYAGGAQMWAAVQAGDVVRLQSFSGRTYSVGRVS